MKHRLWTSAIAAGLATLPSIRAFGQLVAFPGAQGFGADATGGRGGSIYVVTNYNSSGAGSFEDAVSHSNRIVVFAVGGYVDMSAAISCSSSLTILGQTAPGQGIAFMGHEVSFNDSSNDIVQYIRAREGSTDTSAKASINLGGTTNVILDHVDAEFSQYDNIDAVGSPTTNNITLQNSLLGDPIKAQVFNMHTEGNNTTYLNNLFANAEGRSVLAKSNTQFVNNAIYDYGYAYTTGNSGGVYTYDLLDNYFVAGPSTNSAGDAWYQLDSNQSAYSSGNLLDSNKNGVLDGSATTPGGVVTLSSEWSPSTKYLPTLSATAAYAFDLAHSGALYPNGDGTFSRDQVDSQIVTQMASYGTSGAIINEQNDDGLSNNGFGTLAVSNVSSNTLDTVPFSWLMSHGLSTTSDAQLTMPNALGYDMIEEYAQQIGDQYASQTATSGDWATTTWSATKPGIYDHALIRGTGTANGIVNITGSDADSAFTVSIGGNGPATGESLNISGGSLVVQDTIYVGDQNNGSLVMTGGTLRANNVQIGNTVWNANGSSSTTYTGTLTLNGGVLTTGEIVLGGGVAGSWTTGGTVIFGGGTLQALSNLFVNVPVTINSGGATVDTNGYNGSISSVISGTGALSKIGVGVLSLSASNNYSGGTTITAGEVGISTDANIGGTTSAITFNGGLLQVNGTALTNLNTHTVNWSTFNGGFDIATSTNTFTVSQNIGGSGSLTKTGAGTLVLSGTSTFTGGVILNAGTLSVSADPNLGANGGILTFNGGTLLVNGTTLTNTTNHPLGTFGGGTFNISNAANTFTIEQQVNGTGTLTKTGPGILVLGTRDYFTGDTYLNGGTLRVGDPLSLRYTTVHLSTAGTTLDLNGINETIGGLTGNQPFDIKGTSPAIGNNNSAQTFSGVISDSLGTGSVHKIGTGTWSLSGNNTFAGALWFSNGVVDLTTLNNGGVAGPLGGGTNAATNLVFDGGTLQFTGTAGAGTDHLFTMTVNGGTIDGSGSSGDGMDFSNTGAIAFTGTGNRTLNLIGSETHNAFFPALGDADATSHTTLVMNGTGRWLWESKLSTYSGDTSILAGTLRLYQGGFLPSGVGEGNVDVNSGGALVADISTTINGLNNGANGSSGTVTISTGTLSMGGGNANGSFGGVITGSAIAKIGSGTQTLSGTNTFTGTTTITGGTLSISAQGNLGGNGAVIFNGGSLTSAGGFTTSTSQLTNALVVNSPGGGLTNTATMYFSGSITGSGTLTTSTTNADVFTGSGFLAGNNSSGASFTGTLVSQFQTNITDVSASPYANYNASVANTTTFIYGVSTPPAGPIQMGSLTGVTGSTVRNGTTVGIGPVTWQIGSLNTSTGFAGNLIDNNGGIAANTSALNKVGSGNLTLSGADTYTGGTTVTAGTLTFASATAYPNNGSSGTSLTIASGAEMVIANHGTHATYVPQMSVLTNNGTIDITNNAFLVHNGSISAITAEARNAYNNGKWNGTNTSSGVITSSVAAADTSHLTAVGVATGLTSFEGATSLTTDVLVKYTYYGDANLDGRVDGSDYSRIDYGYLNQVSGWYNGDFNYDGVINGSDYTLIDNSFNSQGTQITSQIAEPTASFASPNPGTSAVPEPATLSFATLTALGLLGRRRRFTPS